MDSNIPDKSKPPKTNSDAPADEKPKEYRGDGGSTCVAVRLIHDADTSSRTYRSLRLPAISRLYSHLCEASTPTR